MAMPSTASSCCLPSSSSSSPHGRPLRPRLRLTSTTTAWSPARIRLVSRSAPSQRNPLPVSSGSAPDVAGEDTCEGEDLTAAGGGEVEEDRDERYGFEMEVRKLPGKRNRRLVRAGAGRRAARGRLGHAHRLRGPRRLHPRPLRVPPPPPGRRLRPPLPGRGAGSGAGVQVQRQGHHRLLRGRDGAAPGVRDAPPGDRLQHGRRRFQGLQGQMVCP